MTPLGIWNATNVRLFYVKHTQVQQRQLTDTVTNVVGGLLRRTSDNQARRPWTNTVSCKLSFLCLVCAGTHATCTRLVVLLSVSRMQLIYYSRWIDWYLLIRFQSFFFKLYWVMNSSPFRPWAGVRENAITLHRHRLYNSSPTVYSGILDLDLAGCQREFAILNTCSGART